MFRTGISEESLLSIPCIKGLSPEILLFKRKGTVSRDFSLRDGILPTRPETFVSVTVGLVENELVDFIFSIRSK
jgi:hypothetical protein